MISYWVSFARTGRPTAPGEAAWPRYAPGHGYLHVVEAPHASTNVMPGMFTLNEEVMQRRRRAGDQQWGANVGVAAPVLPPPSKP
jgi:para-nitrobenzyl esterase